MNWRPLETHKAQSEPISSSCKSLWFCFICISTFTPLFFSNEKQHALLCTIYFHFTTFIQSHSSDTCSAFVILKMVFVIWDNKYQISRIRYSLSNSDACCFRSQSLPAWVYNSYNADTVPRGQLASHRDESSELLMAFSGVPDMGHIWTKDLNI